MLPDLLVLNESTLFRSAHLYCDQEAATNIVVRGVFTPLLDTARPVLPSSRYCLILLVSLRSIMIQFMLCKLFGCFRGVGLQDPICTCSPKSPNN
eukprot:6464995-Amphidinium_carterae.2